MRKTIEKEVKTTEKEVKKEFNLKEAFVLWKNTAKSGLEYLSGNTTKYCGELAGAQVVAYFNSKKENPKQPDIKIYVKDDEGKNKEVAVLWDKITKNEKRILTGFTSDEDKEKLVGFYSKSEKENAPYINVYFQED